MCFCADDVCSSQPKMAVFSGFSVPFRLYSKVTNEVNTRKETLRQEEQLPMRLDVGL